MNLFGPICITKLGTKATICTNIFATIASMVAGKWRREAKQWRQSGVGLACILPRIQGCVEYSVSIHQEQYCVEYKLLAV